MFGEIAIGGIHLVEDMQAVADWRRRSPINFKSRERSSSVSGESSL
jgi:hypothetical protein